MATNPTLRLRKIARPMVFLTGVEGYPVSTAGTAFLVGYRREIFVLTARHVTAGCGLNRLMVFPCEAAKRPMRLTELWTVQDPAKHEDSSDLVIIRSSLANIPRNDRNKARLVNMRPDIFNWFDQRWGSTFFIFGYPKSGNSVDYSEQTINSSQVFLTGKYDRPSRVEGCHEVKFENPLGLTDFDGLSGSPIFCVENAIGRPLNIAFCGIAIRGDAAQNRIRFLEAETIQLALDEAIDDLRLTRNKSFALIKRAHGARYTSS